MPDLFASGRATARDIIVLSGGRFPRASGLRLTARGSLRIELNAAQGEPTGSIETRVRRELDELERIAETVSQPWPRLDGEVPSPAEHWLAAGILDAEVEAWLEAGVPWSTSAAQLRRVGITPRDAARELEQGWSLGLIFARGEMDLAEVQALVLGTEGA